MQILHTESSCGWGGQEIRILTEMSGMNARGHHCILVCPKQAPIYQEAVKRGLEVHALPIAKKRLQGVWALRQWLQRHPVDVINTHSSTDSWLSALACKLLRKAPPIVRTRHVSAPVNNQITTRWLYQTATRFIVTTGEQLKETLVQDNGYDSSLIESVTTGIDTNRFKPADKLAVRRTLGLTPDKTYLGIVATLRSWKGHHYLLETLQALPEVELLIVGDGPRRQFLEELVLKLGLTNRVHFVGNQDDVVPWMQAVDLFVLPSYANEGVPQSLLQAMLVGLPVVSTPVGSIREAVLDGETGLLVPPEQTEPLRQALQRLLEQPEYAAILGQAARKRALERFSMEVMLDKMERIFQQVTR